MTGGTSEEKEPALQKTTKPDEEPKDQIVNVIGETGRWQLEKILIVFLVSIPGLAHIFVSAFVAPKRDFWCSEIITDTLDNEVPESIKVNFSSSIIKELLEIMYFAEQLFNYLQQVFI